MARVRVSKSLEKEILATFRGEAETVLRKLKSLEEHPHKGKALANVGGTLLKEVKHKQWRFYGLTDGHILKYGTPEELSLLLIKFLRMSDKKKQQQKINELLDALRTLEKA